MLVPWAAPANTSEGLCGVAPKRPAWLIRQDYIWLGVFLTGASVLGVESG